MLESQPCPRAHSNGYDDSSVYQIIEVPPDAPEDVESWVHGDVSHSGMHGSNPGFKNALVPPPAHVTHLDIYVRLNPPPQAVGRMRTREGSND